MVRFFLFLLVNLLLLISLANAQIITDQPVVELNLEVRNSGKMFLNEQKIQAEQLEHYLTLLSRTSDTVNLNLNFNFGAGEEVFEHIMTNYHQLSTGKHVTMALQLSGNPEWMHMGKMINGTVYDENEQVLPGVKVYYDPELPATYTDLQGNFTIELPADQKHLVFDAENCRTKKVRIKKEGEEIAVTMKSK